jgi:hypothetical protein
MSHICPLNDQPCGCDPNETNPKARTYPCAIARELGKRIRLVASDKDGEALNALAAFLRMGQSKNLLNDLAELIEMRGVRKLYSEKDMKDALSCQKELVRAEVDGEYAEFFDADGEPLWHSIALFCRREADRLTRDRDKVFVDDMVGWTASRIPTEKQSSYLVSIFLKLGGSCAPEFKARYLRR